MLITRKFIYLVVAMIPVFAVAQRLPAGVVPQHYDLTFTPDLQTATFAGEETIQVMLQKPVAAITLNAAELQLSDVAISQGDKTQPAQVALDAQREQATLSVASPLEAGPASIQIRFAGTLNDKLRGFYLAHTTRRNYAVTQFEATDARRAFPSFDEPELKATFSITLIVDSGDTAISNGHIVSDTPGPGTGKHTLSFSTTPRMSSYLVAMAVGDFECTEGAADGIPIRVCGTPDKKPLGRVALGYAEEIIKFYDQYYGIKYPFGKLDIVGAPDFEAGAMENTAAIFYRESLLFIDDKNSSVDSHQAVFEVLAHEMAHQWFGDLVTMKWWDNIWLNEGFATWMALKPSQALHPEWNAVQDAVRETDKALTIDALRNTHPIHARAETPEEINELFDSISYEKAAAVLRMIEGYVSPDVFRRGVNAYLRKFSYGNATAEDFWQTITQTSGRPVDRIMPTFIDQPGGPLINLKVSCVTPPATKVYRRRHRVRVIKGEPKTEIAITQQRFLANPDDASKDNGTWAVPVCFKGSNAKPFCQLISQTQQVVPVAECSSWVFANVNAVGYYRTQYDSEMMQKLSAAVTSDLTTPERISLLQDQAALMRSGQQNIADYLNLVTAVSQDSERDVVKSYSDGLQDIHDYLLNSTNQPVFEAWIRNTFQPMMNKIGWTPAAGETSDTAAVRAELIKILGELGEDPDTIHRAGELAQQYLKNPGSIDPTIADRVLQLAAQHGDVQLFNQMLDRLRQSSSPEELSNLADAMAEFRDPQLEQRWLEIAVSPASRNQDAAHFMARTLSSSDPQVRSFAWGWIKSHWADVQGKMTMSSGAEIVAAAHSFCDAGARDDVQTFFADHNVQSAERALKLTTERINACVSFRRRQEANLAGWLQQHSAISGSGE